MSVRFDLAAHPGAPAYRLLAGLVVPRPIALVTTVDAAGVVNAAPFSFFNVMGTEPALAVLAPADRDDDGRDGCARAPSGLRGNSG